MLHDHHNNNNASTIENIQFLDVEQLLEDKYELSYSDMKICIEHESEKQDRTLVIIIT